MEKQKPVKEVGNDAGWLQRPPRTKLEVRLLQQKNCGKTSTNDSALVVGS